MNATLEKENNTKEWFRINKDVEYSTDFDFFVRNQIGVSKSNITYTFYSKLERKHFATHKCIFGSIHEFSDKQITDFCKTIHQEILVGKHGKGKFVD